MTKRMWISMGMAVMLLVLGASQQAGAELLMSDSFDYTSTDSMDGGYGFAADSEWTTGGSVGSSVTLVDGLTFGTYSTSGKALQMSGVSNAYAARAIGNFISSGTLWMSYLYNCDNNSGGAATRVEYVDVTMDSAGQNLVLYGDASVSGSPVGVKDGTTIRSGTTNVVEQETYLVVGKFENVGVNATATAWRLTVDNWAVISADGEVTEAELDANYQDKAYGSQNSNVMKTYLQFFEYTGRAEVDEIRVGTELADVTVPEPTTMGLLAIGGGLALLRRKK
jgi:hypothetical protein